MGNSNRYKLYFRDKGVLCIEYFRTLKQIKNHIQKKEIFPIQINKLSGNFYPKYKVFDGDIKNEL